MDISIVELKTWLSESHTLSGFVFVFFSFQLTSKSLHLNVGDTVDINEIGLVFLISTGSYKSPQFYFWVITFGSIYFSSFV